MNNEFQIKENGFAEIKKAILIKTIPILMLAGGTAIAISYFNSSRQSSDVNVLPFMIPILLVVIVNGIFKGLRRQKELFESYKLIVNEDEIVREQKNTPTISIPHNEIKSITKNSKGILTIVGNSKTEIIGVPTQIDNSERLEQLLSQIHLITNSDKQSFSQKYNIFVTLLTIGLMASVYLSTNKLIVGITGTLLLLILSYSFYEIRTNKNVDKKTKKITWWLILVLISIIVTMYFKLIG
jgi:hypothetical protein